MDGLAIDPWFLTSYPVTGSSGVCLVWNDVDLLNQYSCSLTQPFICEKVGVTHGPITTTSVIPTTTTTTLISTTMISTTSTVATTIIPSTTTTPTTTLTTPILSTTILTTTPISTTIPTTTTTITTISPTITTTTMPTASAVPTTTLAPTSSPCPSPYIWKPAVSLCYKNYEDTEKWPDAKTMCTGYGARLAILDTAAKLSSVLDGKSSKILPSNDLKTV